MSRNNTGNPIGSKAFPDFEDNVPNLDVAVNGSESEWVDRLGRPRKTLMEMEREFDADQQWREENFNAMQSGELTNRAESAATSAETARDAAFVNADVYPDVATGLAAVADGEQFQVVEGDEIVRYRRDSASTQAEVARYPAVSAIWQMQQSARANFGALAARSAAAAPAPAPDTAAHTDWSGFSRDKSLAESEAPYKDTHVVFSNALDNSSNITTRMGGVVRCLDGSILAMSFVGRGESLDYGEGDVLIKKLSYNPTTRALSIGPLSFLYNGETDPDGNANPARYIGTTSVVLQFGPNRGRVIVYSLWRNEDGSSHRFVYRYSDDHGDTWSSITDISDQFPLEDWSLVSISNTNGVQMPSGRVIIPSWKSNSNYPGGLGVDLEVYPYILRAMLLVSDDDGHTFKETVESPLDELDIPNEDALCISGDGDLIWIMRDRGIDRASGRRWLVRVSPDGERIIGNIYTATDYAGNTHPSSQTMAGLIHTTQEHWSLGAVPKLVMTQGDSVARERPSLYLSYDHGKTWPIKYLINATGGYTMPVVLDDKTLGVLWEDYPGYSHVNFTIVNYAEIFNMGVIQ